MSTETPMTPAAAQKILDAKRKREADEAEAARIARLAKTAAHDARTAKRNAEQRAQQVEVNERKQKMLTALLAEADALLALDPHAFDDVLFAGRAVLARRLDLDTARMRRDVPFREGLMQLIEGTHQALERLRAET
jgi:hypothetical protein